MKLQLQPSWTIFLLSRIFKFIMHAVAIGSAGFAFPVIMQYLGVDLGITVDIFTQLQFAGLAVGLYLLYSLFSLVIAVIKLVFAPIKIIFGTGTGKSELKKVKAELEKIKKGN
mgnify:CR=1 FL=1